MLGLIFYVGEKVYHDGALSTYDSHCESEAANGGTHGLASNQLQIKFLKNIFNKTSLLTIDDKPSCNIILKFL